MTLSAAALVALWGDELAEVGQARMGNTRMPGRATKASTKGLGTAAIALTVWDLWGTGALSWTFERVSLGFIDTTTVTIHASGTPSTPFAAALAGACHEPRRIGPVLQDVLGGEQVDPAGKVLAHARAELADAGVLIHSGDSAARGLVTSLTGGSVFELVPGAADAHRPDWDALSSRWLTWRQTEPGGAQMLLDEARCALSHAHR